MTATFHPDERVAPRVVHAVWGGLLGVLAGAPLLYAQAARRPYSAASSPLFGAVSSSFATSLSRLLSTLVVGCAFVMIALALPVLRMPRLGGRAVLGAVLFGGSFLFSGFWHGTTVGIGFLGLPVVAVALLVFPQPTIEWYGRSLTFVLRVIVWSSVVAGVLVPSWALQRHSVAAVLPVVSSRLAGVTTHPNALGPLVVALLVLEWRRVPRNVPAIAVALGALLWTQSKTSWAALLLLAGIALVRVLRQRSSSPSRLPALVLVAVLGASTYVGLGLLGNDQATTRTDNSAETFTGRAAIWEVTLEVWKQDPVFGYGTNLWGPAMDERYRDRVGFPPGYSHNQLFETLGQAGLLGAAALVLFLVGFASLSARADSVTSGAAGALLLLLVVQCFSEVPLQSVPYTSSFFLTCAVLGYALVGANDAPDG